MISKYKGVCRTCGKPYAAGAEIHWSREDGGHHATCWDSRPEELPFDKEEAEELAQRLGFKHYPASPEGER